MRLIVHRLMRRLLSMWVRTKILPASLEEAGVDLSRPLCFVLETNAYSNLLILEEATLRSGMPSPFSPAPDDPLGSGNSYFVLKRFKGLLWRRPEVRRHSPSLARLVKRVSETGRPDCQIVPVSIFLGRAPDKLHGPFKILFSENWVVAGRIRRFISILLHGRDTIVQFSSPISVRDVLSEDLGEERSVRKISRVLRVHFRRVRAAVIGPDLSHRRTILDELLRTSAVRDAIDVQARKAGRDSASTTRLARGYGREILADYSHSVVRFFWRLLTWFWNRIYDGVDCANLDQVTQVRPGHEIIYVPCHRSHIDYLLISYLLYTHGRMVPHIAAGLNLNLPIVGPIMRRAGAFFIRRTFRSNALYSAVFTEYVNALISRGVPIEFFVEGTRSRTGRLLQPRGGMLSMVVRGYLRTRERPVAFMPVFIGYEKLVEGNSYLGELSGSAKKKETVLGLLRSYKVLLRKYGKAQVSFGEPIYLEDHLNELAPQWQETPAGDDRPQWLAPSVNELGRRIMTGINATAQVNPISLLAVALLATPKQSMAEEDLIELLELYQNLLATGPVPPHIGVSSLSGAEIIEYGESLQAVERKSHRMGDIISVTSDQSVLLTYFKNTVLHLFVVTGWCACCFLNNVSFSGRAIKRFGNTVYPFLESELFLHWDKSGFGEAVDQALKTLKDAGLIYAKGEADRLQRAKGGSREAMQLKVLGKVVVHPLERFYITAAVLAQHGSETLTTAHLEDLCQATAQRLSLIYGMEAPEFFDRKLFTNLVRTFKREGLISKNEAGLLAFGSDLESIIQEAKVILSKDIRHSILEATPKTAEQPPESTQAAA